jgi:hypothetical protein
MPTVPERLSSLETGLDNHKVQCVSDKQEIKDRFDSIDNKLWACIGILVVYLFSALGWMIVENPPWETEHTQIADRGERK